MRTKTKIIRADAIRSVRWCDAGLELTDSGERFPLSIRVPAYGYSDEAGESYEDYDNGADLDQELLRAIAAAARIPGGAVICLDHDENLKAKWGIEPLTPAAPAAEG